MQDKIEFFDNGDYKLILNLIDDKMSILKNIEDFNEKYRKFFDDIDELQLILNDEQKNLFNEIVSLFYSLEEYYLALSYSLGVKYGQDLNKI